MNEQVLATIIQLQAIIAKVGGLTDKDQVIIEMFLDDHVNDVIAKKYIKLFDTYTLEPVKSKEETEKICLSINKELSFKQKTFILLHLIELVLANHVIDEKEEAYMLTVCHSFKIDVETYHQIKFFVQATDITKYDRGEVLIISPDKHTENPSHKALHRPSLKSKIAVLKLPTVDMFVLRCIDLKDALYLNGEILRSTHIYLISIGSVIRGDQINSIYYSEILNEFHSSSRDINITFKASKLRYYFKNGEKGLHNIDIEEKEGKLIALMGASGSGKSTLLNVLNGNLSPQVGNVTINGINIHTEKEKIEGVIGYIPQDDLLIEDLTVYENLYYAAKLCFDDYSEVKLYELVNQTLGDLGLFEIKDLKVGSVLEKTISGGQRKRVNIALELLRQPSVLFVDEPTSGLSSRDSENIMDLLRELTLQGKLIFVVIHQPSSDIFKLFDKLVILDVGGFQIYYGNPVEALIYFKKQANQALKELGECEICGNVNVEQIFSIIESKALDEFGHPTKLRKTSPEKWYQLFRQSEPAIKVRKKKKKENAPLESNLNIASYLKQFIVFFQRDLLAKIRNTQYMNINFFQAPFLAILLAFTVRFYDADKLAGPQDYVFSENMNIPAFIFMSIIVALFIGLVMSAEEIIKDARIVKREAFLNLNRHAYLLSKVSILFGFSAIQILAYVLIGNFIIGIHEMTFQYWLVLFSSACFACMLGLNISATFNRVVTIYILIPILLIPQLILGGLVVKFDEVNPRIANKEDLVPLFGDIMASRWAFEALAVSQFKENPYEMDYYAIDKQKANAEYKKVYYIPALKARIDRGLNLKAKGKDFEKEYESDLKLLRRELQKEKQNFPDIQFSSLAKLTPKAFNKAVADSTKNYLAQLRKIYNKHYNTAVQSRDKLVNSHIKSPEEREIYVERMKQFKNDRLTDLVTNKRSDKRIVEYHERLIQKIYPIYQSPSNINHFLDYRAHFFAPEKHLFGQMFSTLTFNVCIIWGMALLLYVTLYFNLFKRTLIRLSLIKKRIMPSRNSISS